VDGTIQSQLDGGRRNRRREAQQRLLHRGGGNSVDAVHVEVVEQLALVDDDPRRFGTPPPVTTDLDQIGAGTGEAPQFRGGSV
jgi:hypothetical protein